MKMLIREEVGFDAPEIAQALEKQSTVAKVRSGQKRLIVEIASIHEGITSNFNKYTKEELTRAVDSWMLPYPKPILLNHDMNSEPMGRMLESFIKESVDKRAYIALRAVISDPLAMAKVVDGRYLTGSVGGMPEAAICSICHVDVVSASREGDGCGHRRGGKYDEKTCVYEHRGIKFYEYSFVNAPGDSESLITVKNEESNMSLYSIDMQEQSVLMMSESSGLVNAREFMSEKDAHNLYLNLAFGSKAVDVLTKELEQITQTIMLNEKASTIEEDPANSDEDLTQMDHDITEEEDILSVTDKLSADLTSKESETTSEEEVTEEVATEEEAPAEEVVAEEAEDEAEVEAKEEEVQETPSEESEVTPADESEIETTEEIEEAAATDEVVEEPDHLEVPSIEELQAQLVEIKAANAELIAQNVKMKEAIHKELASKVVEARIATGLTDISEKEAELEAYATRSASSLADSFVDVRKYAENNNFQVVVVEGHGQVPSLDIKAVAIEEAHSEIVTDEEEVVEPVAKVKEEDVFVDKFSALLIKGTEKFHLKIQG